MTKRRIEHAPAGQGLRARGKRERRRRLREAARAVFLKRGYEGATTREIAARADVAIGTLFVYATEKRDLLFLIFNDDLDAIVETAIARVVPGQPLIKQLLTIFRPIYRYFEHNVVIGRYGIHEVLLMQVERPELLGPEARRVVARREKLRRALATVFERKKTAGRLAASERGQAIAEMFLWLHWCNVQSWVAARTPRSAAGVRALRQVFATVIRGLGPKPGEL